jgi:Protein of unknown function (DUF3892)
MKGLLKMVGINLFNKENSSEYKALRRRMKPICSPESMNVEDIINKIKNGDKFFTEKNGSKREVEIVEERYIRSLKDGTIDNNLLELPEF